MLYVSYPTATKSRTIIFKQLIIFMALSSLHGVEMPGQGHALVAVTNSTTRSNCETIGRLIHKQTINLFIVEMMFVYLRFLGGIRTAI